MLAKKGRAVVIGSRGTIEINPRDAMGREADIRGVTLLSTTEAESKQMHAALVAGLEDGTLRPVIAQKIPLAEAARAHVEVMKTIRGAGKDRAGYVVSRRRMYSASSGQELLRIVPRGTLPAQNALSSVSNWVQGEKPGPDSLFQTYN